jgi:tetraacyldisaccharide 4'-kinase
MNQRDYRELVSGERQGVGAMLLRTALLAAALCYGAVVGMRNLLYGLGVLKAHRARGAVISIGNITVGGTGKTPLVIWVCKLLRERHIPCAVLTRGYKASGEALSDEPAILAESLGDVGVVVNPDRVAGAADAVKRLGARVMVMDDGFQHRRLARDLDVVTVDATLPFGYGKMLPAGLLREPIRSLRRANAVVITRSDQVSEAELGELEGVLRRANPRLVTARTVHKVSCLKALDEAETPIEKLKGKRVYAFCGIGNPEGFVRTLEGLGAEVVGRRFFDDHHRYTDPEIREIEQEGAELKSDLILTTQKDRTKLSPAAGAGNISVAYLSVDIDFRSGGEQFKGLIESALAGTIAGNRNWQ